MIPITIMGVIIVSFDILLVRLTLVYKIRIWIWLSGHVHPKAFQSLKKKKQIHRIQSVNIDYLNIDG